MNKRKQVLILATIAAVAAVGGVIAINSSSGFSVQANQRGRNGVQKWEYCAIIYSHSTSDGFNRKGITMIHYFQAGGLRAETVEFIPDAGQRFMTHTEEALSKAMAKLGDEGWEMVMKEPDSDNISRKVFYFKRPKQ
ncbi:MAG: hypothetical protein L0287_16575 [Anaerolineae bacterium]|nr:hypothetical protein [Anaerolineae bacterium]MCI0660279.1 hypothetical protein [Acidobacteriota bacterium]